MLGHCQPAAIPTEPFGQDPRFSVGYLLNCNNHPSHAQAHPAFDTGAPRSKPRPKLDIARASHLDVVAPSLSPRLTIRNPDPSPPMLADSIEPSSLAPPPPVPTTVSGRYLASHTLHPTFDANYVLGDELGSGGFGFVVAATKVWDGMPVACKFIFKGKVPSHGWVRDPKLGVIPMEAFVLRIVKHDGVVRFVDLFEDDKFFYLVMEHHGTPWTSSSKRDAAAYGARDGSQPPSATSTLVDSPFTERFPQNDLNNAAAAMATAKHNASIAQGLLPYKSECCNAASPTRAVFPDGRAGVGVPGAVGVVGSERGENMQVDEMVSESSSGVTAVSCAAPSSTPMTISASAPPPSHPSRNISSRGPPRASSSASLRHSSLAVPVKGDAGSMMGASAPMVRRSSCDLFECIEQHSRLGEETARYVFAQVVDAVWYLDRMGICHRDIKDENLVVDKDFRVKLIDFGSAVVWDPRKPPPYYTRFYGTMTFAASEILSGRPYRSPQAEVWSLGVLLSILLTGECPFSDPMHAIKGRISRPKVPISRDALDVILACLVVDPDRRATIGEVRSHPWVSKAWDLRGGRRESAAF